MSKRHKHTETPPPARQLKASTDDIAWAEQLDRKLRAQLLQVEEARKDLEDTLRQQQPQPETEVVAEHARLGGARTILRRQILEIERRMAVWNPPF